MKKLIIFFALLFNVANAQIKLMQLQPCIKNGQRTDSCFIMTDVNGVPKYISLADLIGIAGGGTLTPNPDGSYTYSSGANNTTLKYTCQVIQDSVIKIYNYQGSLASTCTITGMGKAFKAVTTINDSTIRFTNISGQTYSINMCPFVRNCETRTTLTYNTNTNNLTFTNESGTPVTINLNESTITNSNGVYTFTNELNASTDIGYHLNCVNDSTIQLLDEQGNVVSTCGIIGGNNGGETITNIWNNPDGSYTYRNEAGVDTTFGYKFDVSQIGVNGYFYLTDKDGTHIDSVNLCNPACPAINGLAVNDTFTITACAPYAGKLTGNDTPCEIGIGVYSLIEGSEIGGLVTVDADGSFVYSPTNCDSTANHTFSYQMKCKDGSTFTASVKINLPGCGGATANLDQYSGQKNTTITFNVKSNDVACAAPKVTTYKVQLNPTYGTLALNSNGSGTYNSLPTFIGTDSAIIGVYCNGVMCDTSLLKFTVKAGNQLTDDYYSVVQGDSLTGLDVSTNDIACSVGVTTYTWNGALFPASAGTITGNPASGFKFVASPFFCGVAHRDYDQNCDGVFNYTATAYFYVSCGNAIDDDWTTLDTIFKENVGGNDAPCSNGGVTTWHILNHLTSHGTGLSIAPFNCIGGCPGSTPDTDALITAWDTITGAFTLTLPGDFSDEVCFQYVMKCKAGGKTYLDTACVRIVRTIQAEITQTVVMKDTITPEFKFTWGAWCRDADNKKHLLVNGDKINFRMNTLHGNINVDLIVGQNIKLGSGYTNDVGNRWATWVVPSITSSPGIMSPSALLNGTYTFQFRKDTFARKSGNWGDNSHVSGLDIGQQLLPSVGVCCTSCNYSTVDVDTIPKLWSTINLAQWSEKGSLYTCSEIYNIAHLLGVNSFYAQPFNGEAAKFYTFTQSRPDTSGAWTNMPKTGDVNLGWYQFAAYCQKPSLNMSGYNEWRTDYDTSATYINVTPQHLEYGTKTDIHRYLASSSGGTNHVRLFESVNKKSYKTGSTLSILEPNVYGYGTYTNDQAARPPGTTIARITLYIAQTPGDYANVPATRYNIFDVTSGINQNTAFSEALPEVKWDMPSVEGAYHHWGYMLSNDGKYYSLTNGQVILFSY